MMGLNYTINSETPEKILLTFSVDGPAYTNQGFSEDYSASLSKDIHKLVSATPTTPHTPAAIS